ncbi:MAG: hypothetical protein Q8909_05295 [Bacteroidota bacterium]|uniref:hypothetical protein n=1 Tax=Parabacteroides sp. FAFU027 TaxID=2922715 RepID=UPI001FB04AD9|nr:hypothetical protein [Parabacteroides sp. FAFU027]MDP4269523.1 hypothetical protein [Bacteroidota bacterium]
MKANVLATVLIIYLAIIAVVAFPKYKESGDWITYGAIIAGQFCIILLLRFFTLRREKMMKNPNDKDKQKE